MIKISLRLPGISIDHNITSTSSTENDLELHVMDIEQAFLFRPTSCLEE